MRDRADNCVIICSIENVDPMGVHTGDSITVAPAQTLTDVEYQQMRDAAFACIRRVGVETGGSNVQFAVDPATGRQVVIEMNPRVSRSSALASKATGFPIAKIAAKLAVGYTLDEIPNDITKADAGQLRAGHRLRRHQDPALGVREAARHDRRPRHPDAVGRRGDGDRAHVPREPAEGAALARAGPPRAQLRPGRGRSSTTLDRRRAARRDRRRRRPSGSSRSASCCAAASPSSAIHDACRIDPWFLDQMLAIVEERARARRRPGPTAMTRAAWRRAKRLGFADAQLAHLWGVDEADVRAAREAAGVHPTYKTVDTCAAEFAAETPYHYSTYEDESEVAPVGPAAGRHPRLGPEPHRPGHRVRLLLRARQLRPARGRLRDGDDQLQPGDGVDRLRHVATACTSSRSRARTCSTCIAAETAAAGAYRPR